MSAAAARRRQPGCRRRAARRPRLPQARQPRSLSFAFGSPSPCRFSRCQPKPREAAGFLRDRQRKVNGRSSISIPVRRRRLPDLASAAVRIQHPAREGFRQPPLHCEPTWGVSSAGERRLCKPEVAGSIPARSTREKSLNPSRILHARVTSAKRTAGHLHFWAQPLSVALVSGEAGAGHSTRRTEAPSQRLGATYSAEAAGTAHAAAASSEAPRPTDETGNPAN